MTRILGIESSCDETAAAVVEDRTEVRSSVIASQIDVHRKYGGVVPELAARHHVQAIRPVIAEALETASCTLDDIDAVAVTQGPGLVGSLLVGVSAAKALAWHSGKPLIAVNHLEGHIRSTFIETPEVEYPVLALIVSGGHTSLYLSPEEGRYHLLAKTRDDAVGEAFDKVAKLMGLGYPGGPIIERISREGNDKAIVFPQAQMKDHSLDFSFSGLKTAVRKAAQRAGVAQSAYAPAGDEANVKQEVRDIAASFQRSAVTVLVRRCLLAARREGVRTILVSGGVACNGRLRADFAKACGEKGLRVVFPSPKYTTDNAAMIAAAAFLPYERNEFADWTLNADTGLRL